MAKPSAVIFLHCSLSNYWNLFILLKDSLCLQYICLWTHIHKLLLTIRPEYISNWNYRSTYRKKLQKHWRILSYFFFTPVLLLLSIALTVTNTFSACLFHISVGRVNPVTFVATLTSHNHGYSGSSMPLPCSISASSSAEQLSSLSFGLAKSPFKLSQL